MAEIDAWRRERLVRLTSDRGWLTVVDRFTLAEGDNALPFGTIRLEDGVARLADKDLVPDTGDGGDALTHEGRTYELVKRGDDLAVRVRDVSSVARRDFRGLEHYPVNPAWRTTAVLREYSRARVISLDYGDGETGVLPVPGELVFALAGGRWTLEPTWDGKRYLLLFGDLTNKTETYAAGRLLYADPSLDGKVLLDFNKAMNPGCAFSPHVRCPLPPARNRMGIRVEAGEKRYG